MQPPKGIGHFIFIQLVCLLYSVGQGTSQIDQNKAEVIEQIFGKIKSAESSLDTAAIIKQKNRLAIRYASMDLLARSRKVARDNIALATTYGDTCLLGTTLNAMGIVMSYHKEFDRFTSTPGENFFAWADSSFKYYRRALALKYDKNCASSHEGWAYAGLMRTHYFVARMGNRDFDSAFVYGKKLEQIAIQRHDLQQLQDAHLWIARSHALIQNYVEANRSIKKAYQLALEIDAGYGNIFDAWFGILTLESGSDTILWLHSEIVNDIRNKAGIEMQNAIQEADIKYQTEKKEAEILAQKKAIRNRDQVIIIIVVSIIAIGVLAGYLFFLYRKNRKLSLRNEVLLKEQNHRVKNNLQMINSLLSLQSQKLISEDAKSVLSESQMRINSVALLHRMLYEGESIGKIDADTYLKALTEEVKYGAPRGMQLDLHVEVGNVIAIERATSLGLIVNELLTNSIKHVDEAKPLAVEIALKQEVSGMTLIYRDNGPGVSEQTWNSSKSFGNQLIRIQSEQLRGEYAVSSVSCFLYELKIRDR